MTSAGALTVTVRWGGGRVQGVVPALARPRAADLLVGRTPAQALLLVPRLHAICANAQAAAARSALAAAGAALAPEAREGVRVLFEAAQEHLWRLLRDWPEALGVEAGAAGEAFGGWYRRLAAASRAGLEGDPDLPKALHAFVADAVVGAGLDADSDEAALLAWAERAPSPSAALVRALAREPALGPASAPAGFLARPRAAALGADAFAEGGARPALDGAPAETGPLARRRGDRLVADLLARRGPSLLARLVARVLDLQTVARRIAAGDTALEGDAAAVGPGEAVSAVETARGTLLHRVRLEGGRIASYAIVAPTAWNFHPEGAFAQAASTIVAADAPALRAAIRRWVIAFDPCVPWDLALASG